MNHESARLGAVGSSREKTVNIWGGDKYCQPSILQPSFEEETVAQVHHDATNKYRGVALGVDRPDIESRLD